MRIEIVPARVRASAVVTAAVFGMSCFVSAAALGQGTVLPQIVVSPTTIPTPVEQIGSSVTVVQGTAIERDQQRTVADVLAPLPGLHLVQTGGPGGATAVFLRGSNANHVKVLIDGIDVADPTSPNGAVDIAHLLSAGVERVEILRGPQGGLYGANAIGGVISIVTKKGSGPIKVTGTFEGGSYGTANQSASVSGSKDRVNFRLDVTHLQTASMPVTPDYVLPPGRSRNNDYYDNLTYSTKLGFDLTDTFSINLVGRLTDSKLRFTNDTFDLGTFLLTPNASQTTQTARQAFGRAEAVWSLFDGRFVNIFGFNATSFDRTSRDPAPVAPQTFKGGREKFDWRGNVTLAPGKILVLGLEHENEHVNVPAISASRGNKAGFAELQLGWMDRLFLVANVRVDRNDDFGSHRTWRVAPAFIVPVTQTKLKASYGTGFKAPTLLELYGDDPANLFVANRGLMPEESKGYDIGFEQPLSPWGRFGFTYFRNDVTNLINFVQVSPGLFSNANIGKAGIWGFEMFVESQVTDRLKVRGDYTQTIARNLVTGAELIRRPRDKYSASMVWQPTDPLTVSATYHYVSGWADFDRPTSATISAPGYAVVNLAANYVVNRHVTAFGRIDNLFDRRYENPYGWMRPGLGVYGGLRLSN